jgi:predicted RNase H-like HicB family nuclease
MAIKDAVLAAAQRLCAARDRPEFSADEIVRALPHLNERSVLTHVTSRCCVNAAPHHQSRLPYFRRISRGRYELLPAYRTPTTRTTRDRRTGAVGTSATLPDTIHAVVTRSGDQYVAACHEVAVVTEGRTLDETLANLTEAVSLHLDGEDLASFGLSAVRRIHVTYELAAAIDAA